MSGVYDDVEFEGLTEQEKTEIVERRERMKAEYQSAMENNLEKREKIKEAEKSLVVLEVKPWDETINLVELWEIIVQYQQDGLSWGETYRLEPVVAEINKLVMTCTIVDNLVLLDDITEEIEALEDYVQSVDIVSMNKL